MTLSASTGPLTTAYDVALLDLDGVVYVGADAVPAAPAALRAARAAGMSLAFVTNNAARPPEAVAQHLSALGVPAEPGEVTTSAQAAAHYLADLLPAGARVLVIGTTGLVEALAQRGLTPVHQASDSPAAVVQGYAPDLNWALLAEGCVAIRSGIPWIATNLDATVPSPRGPLPGNGSLVAALERATGVTPTATGKPDPTMHRESLERSGASRPIVVGDRLDTDIEGAQRVGCPSLLVFSGVTGPAELLTAPADRRPTFLGRDVAALLLRHPGVDRVDGGHRCGRWTAGGTGTEVALALSDRGGQAGPTATGTQADEDLDALRALCARAWEASDAGEAPLRYSADGSDAAAVLERFGLA